MQELIADAPIEPNALCDLAHVCARFFAKRGHFVDESDLCGEECVGGVFDHFRAFQIGCHNREIAQEQGPVNFGHDFRRTVAFDADDDPVGAHEVVDCRALAQKFRVRGNIEFKRRIRLGNDFSDLAVGAHGHRRFGHDDHVAGGGSGNLFCGGENVGQIGVPVAAPGRGADGDENRLGALKCSVQILREAQPAGGGVLGQKCLQTRLEDRHLALFEHRDFVGVPVDADDIVAEIGKADAGDQPDVSCTDHCNSH